MNARWKLLPALAVSAITALLVGLTAGPAQAQATSPGADEPVVDCEVSYAVAAQWLEGFTAHVT